MAFALKQLENLHLRSHQPLL